MLYLKLVHYVPNIEWKWIPYPQIYLILLWTLYHHKGLAVIIIYHLAIINNFILVQHYEQWFLNAHKKPLFNFISELNHFLKWVKYVAHNNCIIIVGFICLPPLQTQRHILIFSCFSITCFSYSFVLAYQALELTI